MSSIRKTARNVARRPLFSFAQAPPRREDLKAAQGLVGLQDAGVVEEFESDFAAIVGRGNAVSFASGRMGFFALLRALGVGAGDEVIIPAFTCSVMANAILRAGATPIFCDIDNHSLGTDAHSVERVASPRTKAIIAQHSFGYACDAAAVRDVADSLGAVMIEDCATTLGTTISGKGVGNFGHAALFSLDHSKPINTLLGGLIYSLDQEILQSVSALRNQAPNLSEMHQQRIFDRLMRECQWANPRQQWRLGAMDILEGVGRRLGSSESAFLDGDYLPSSDMPRYPYPSRYPSFLAHLGIAQLRDWPQEQARRVDALEGLLGILRRSSSGDWLPGVLRDESQSIVPLRLAWSDPQGERLRNRISNFVTTEGTWFMSPVVSTPRPSDEYGYRWGSCPTAESLYEGMVNLPIVTDPTYAEAYLARLRDALKKM